jgi:flavorubredoxin
MQPSKEGSTKIDEIANSIYRISTPILPADMPGGFTFNQYLIVDDAPLLYHTGPRGVFPMVCEAIESVIPVQSLRYIGFSHYESDECGSLNDFLEVAPEAEPLCSNIAKLVSIDDIALRAARALADGEELSLGVHVVRWIEISITQRISNVPAHTL